MFKKIQQLRLKYPFLKIIWNRYFLVVLFFVIWMLFLDNYSYIDHRLLNKEITADSIKIKKLQNPDMIEKYAREKYFMKKDSEDIYIIEFEDDLHDEESKKRF